MTKIDEIKNEIKTITNAGVQNILNKMLDLITEPKAVEPDKTETVTE